MNDLHDRLVRLETETKAQTKILIEVCRDNKKLLRENASKELKNEKRFSRMEADLKWTRAIGGFFVTAIGAVLKLIWTHK